MTLVIPVNHGQAAYRFQLANDPQPMIFTLGTTMAGSANWQARADKLADDFMAGFPVAFIGNQYTFLGVHIRTGAAAGGAAGLVEANRNHVGTDSGPALPQNVAFLVKKVTASAGRRNRGRMFFPPWLIGEGSVSAVGIIDAQTRTGLQTRINNAFLGDFFVVLHDSGPPGSLAPPAPTPITSFVLDARVATQRRRLR